MWYAETAAGDNALTEALVAKKLVVLATDAPESLITKCIVFMNYGLSGHNRDYWVCATMAAVLNTDYGRQLFEFAENREKLKSNMKEIIERNQGNKPLIYVAHMLSIV